LPFDLVGFAFVAFIIPYHLYDITIYFLLRFLAVLADCLKALAVGAPLAPTLRIVSPEPSLMRFFLAFMFA
jgi:hypothetical protein